MYINKYNDVKLFTAELQKLASCDRSEWRGHIVSNGAPVNSENIIELLAQNQHLINQYAGIDLEFNRSLIALSNRMKNELSDVMAFDIANQLKELATTVRQVAQPVIAQPFLPKEILSHIMSFAPQNPAEAKAFFDNNSLVCKRWKNAANDAKESWLNSHHRSVEGLFSYDMVKAKVCGFLRAHGKNLTCLSVGENTNVPNEYLWEAAAYCPNAEKVVLNNVFLTQEVIEILESMPNLKHLELRNCGIGHNFTRFPQQLKSLSYHNNCSSQTRIYDNQLPPKLEELKLDSAFLVELPRKLPETLQKLSLNNCIIGFNKIPDGIKHLSLTDYRDHRTPLTLPNQLETLCLDGLKVENPCNIPESVKKISLRNMQYGYIPIRLNPNLQSLDLTGSPVNSIDALPAGLKELVLKDCSFLQGLPDNLPASLELKF